MICIDNSEWMRNGDYAPSRFQAQADAVNLICGAKTQVKLIMDVSSILPSFGFWENLLDERKLDIMIGGLRWGDLSIYY